LTQKLEFKETKIVCHLTAQLSKFKWSHCCLYFLFS